MQLPTIMSLPVIRWYNSQTCGQTHYSYYLLVGSYKAPSLDKVVAFAATESKLIYFDNDNTTQQ